MNYFIHTFFLIMLSVIYFYNFAFAQESYLINKNKTAITVESKTSQEADNEKSIQKNEKAKANNISKAKNDIKFEDSFILKNNMFKVIYKPNQINLGQEDIIKIIELSNNLNKESVLIIKSYASKNTNQGSSEARRISLSRALEIRSLFIENEFPATNILVKALGSETNNEGFTDLVVVEVN